MDDLSRSLGRLQRRRCLQRTVATTATVLAWSAGSAAAVLLICRVAAIDPPWLTPVAVACAALAPLLWVPRAWARRDSPHQLAARLHRLAHGEGLIMALAAQEDGQRPAGWLARVGPGLHGVELPQPSLRPLRLTILPVLCLVILAALPPRALPPAAVKAPWLAATRAAAERLEEDRALFREQERQELAEQAQRLAGLGAEHGQAAWDAVERLERSIADGESRAVERLANAIAASERAAAGGPGSFNELAASLAALSADAPGLSPQSALDPATAAALASALAGLALDPAQQQALAKAGLLPPGTTAAPLDPAALKRLAEGLKKSLTSCTKPGCCSGGALEAALARCSGGKPAAVAAAASGTCAGKGGVDEGPGHGVLALDHQGTTSPLGDSDTLPSNALDPHAASTVATLTVDPEKSQKTADFSHNSTFDAHAADARRASVAPRHRSAVGRYFSPAASPPAHPPAATAPTDTVIP